MSTLVSLYMRIQSLILIIIISTKKVSLINRYHKVTTTDYQHCLSTFSMTIINSSPPNIYILFRIFLSPKLHKYSRNYQNCLFIFSVTSINSSPLNIYFPVREGFLFSSGVNICRPKYSSRITKSLVTLIN